MELIIILLIVVGVLALALVGFVVTRRGREVVAPEAAPVEAPVARRLADRLGKARTALGDRLGVVLSRGAVDREFWSELEETLLASDVGVATTRLVVDAVRERHPADPASAREALAAELRAVFEGKDRDLHLDGRPAVVMVVGVNGTGKTTSIAKLAAYVRRGGTLPLLAAADTYRAAADEQLRTWAGRVGVEVVGGEPGADPASVAFDALQAARARGAGAVIVDTAGRLHSNKNLMNELGKVARVLRREAGELDEVLLVIDATTGQNGIAQAHTFAEVVGLTGVVLTKMDGTARGGVVAAVERETGVPVKFIGVGEGMDDLLPFDPDEFVGALLG